MTTPFVDHLVSAHLTSCEWAPELIIP